MRCPKCQYVGFEPSPRCKNCGYDLSLASTLDQASERMDDDAPSLTLVIEDEPEAPMSDFELQIFDDVPVMKVQGGAKAFDLDDLLANGPASGSAASRESEPVIQPVSAVARRRQSAASASASSSAPAFSSSASSSSSSASAVATPPAVEIEALFKPAPVAKAPAVKAPVVVAPIVQAPVVEAPVAKAPVAEAPVVEAPVVETVVAAASVAPAPPPAPAPAPPAPVTTELPLFMQGMSEISAPPPAKRAPVSSRPAAHAPVPASVEAAADAMIADAGSDAEIDDRPLVQVPASPRAPLAVRRTTPDPARLRAKYGRAARAKAEPSEMSGDLPLNATDPDAADAGPRVDPRIVPPVERMSAEPTPTSLPAEWLPGVGPAKRLMAAALDGALLVALDAAVVWFTLSVCGLAPGQANLLPLAPLLLFFLLLDAGYLVLFTAACGQTLGKMAAGIRVVGTTTGAVINDRITIAQALMRSVGSIASMLPLGAGFWFALVGDRRAAHDRLAHTRVVAQ